MTPSYAFFKLATEGGGLELVTSNLMYNNGDYTIDFEDFRRKQKMRKVTLTIFCNPHNPTGRVWTDDELQEFGEICLENNVMIISDEIHCDLLRTGKNFTLWHDFSLKATRSLPVWHPVKLLIWLVL